MVESFGCLIIFYIGLKCHFNYFVLYIYIYIYIYIVYVYIYIYSSYDERIQRKQSAITVKVTLTSTRCDTVFHNVRK